MSVAVDTTVTTNSTSPLDSSRARLSDDSPRHPRKRFRHKSFLRRLTTSRNSSTHVRECRAHEP